MEGSNQFPNGIPEIQDYGATEPAFGSSMSPVGATLPASESGFDDYGPTSPAGVTRGVEDFDNYGAQNMGPSGPDFAPGPGGGRTVPSGNNPFDVFPPDDGGRRGPQDFDNIGATTPVTSNGIPGFQPVVGWLVCIDGPERGKDYRIHPENNFIGRSESNDICIRGDSKISRERHIMVVYDSEDRMFYIGAPAGINIVKLNGKPVLEARELHPYDIITIGSSKLMFAPFCGERFGWDE